MITVIYCLLISAIVYGSYRMQYTNNKHNSFAENIAITVLLSFLNSLFLVLFGGIVFAGHALFKDFVTIILN